MKKPVLKRPKLTVKYFPYHRRDFLRIFLAGASLSALTLALVWILDFLVFRGRHITLAFFLPSLFLTSFLCGLTAFHYSNFIFKKYRKYAREFYRTILEFEKGNLQYPVNIDNKAYFDAVATRIRHYLLNTDRIMNSIEKTQEELQKRIFEIITVLVNALEEKDTYTAGHSNRVAKYSLIIGERLGLSDEKLRLLSQAAIIHDIGKLSIPSYIIEKPAHLSEEERLIMMSHPVRAVKILCSIEYLKDIAEIVLYHHERFDGKGYYMVSEEDIPLLSRIITIADSYDAMRTDRPYRKALSKADAVRELKTHSGSQFDSRCVEAFLSSIHELE